MGDNLEYAHNFLRARGAHINICTRTNLVVRQKPLLHMDTFLAMAHGFDPRPWVSAANRLKLPQKYGAYASKCSRNCVTGLLMMILGGFSTGRNRHILRKELGLLLMVLNLWRILVYARNYPQTPWNRRSHACKWISTTYGTFRKDLRRIF